MKSENELTILRLIVIVGFAIMATASCSDDDPKPKNETEMNLRVTRPDTIYADVATKALLYQYPVGLRKWGMRITVTDDPTSGNNCEWVLVKGMSDTLKSNNLNWAPATIEIGQYNMTDPGMGNGSTKLVAHGLANFKKVRGMRAVVRDDDDLVYTNLDRIELSAGGVQQGIAAGIQGIDAVNITIYTNPFLFYDDAAYNNNPPINRGWIHLDY